MKICLARIGSISLWAKVEPQNSYPPTLHLWMESELSGSQLAMTLNFEEVTAFMKNATALLRNLKP